MNDNKKPGEPLGKMPTTQYCSTPEEQEQLDKKMQELDQKMLEETERYYARLDLKYGIAFALSIIALLINVINLLRL